MTSKLIRTTSVIAVTAFSIAALCAASQGARAEPAEMIRLAQNTDDGGEGQNKNAEDPNADGKPKGEGRRRDGNRPERGDGGPRGEQRGERGQGGQRGEQRGERGQGNGGDGNAPAKTGNRPDGGKPNLPKIINTPDAAEKRDAPGTINRPPKPVVNPAAKPNVPPPVKPEAVQTPPVVKPAAKPPAPKPVVHPDTLPAAKPEIENTTGVPPAAKQPPAKTAEPPVRRNPNIPGVTPPSRTAEPPVRPSTPPDRRQPNAGRPVTPVVGQPPVKNLNEAKSGRIERREDGGNRLVIKEADKRTIVKQGNRIVIQKDESAQLRRLSPNAVVTRDRRGRDKTVVERRDNTQVITETDRSGQLLRRYRRDRDGRETVIIDNRRRKDNFGRNLAIGVGVGAGIVAGAAILNSVVDVPPPRVRVPREKYIVDYERASEDDVYEALNAPPVDDIDRSYTLDQVRATPYLRERMRRVDLDDITFETGSWDIDPSQYRKLERIAHAMRRVINRNPNEVFLIEGYTDAVGSEVDNLTLSDRRAEAVSVVLTQEFEVPFENLTTQGYGEQYLKIPTDGPERANRRVAARRITPLLNRDISSAPPPPPRPSYDDRRDYDDRGDRYDEPPRHNRWRRYN